MTGRRVGLIRVLTTDDPDLLAAHGKIIMDLLPGLEVVTRCIPGQPEGVYDDRTEAAARPKVVELAREMACEGLSAIVISCAADPGLEEARRAVGLPVVGAGSATALLALGLGGTVGVLGIGERAPAAMTRILGGSLVAVEKPVGVRTTLDLLRAEGQAAAVAGASRLKEKGIEVVALACTGMSTIGMARTLRREVGLRVVDPVTAAGLFAWYAVRDD